MIHPLFDRWLGIHVTEASEYSAPRKTEELLSWTEKARRELEPKGLTEVMSALGRERIERARKRLAGRSPAERRQVLRDEWAELLGPVQPARSPVVRGRSIEEKPVAGATVERITLEVEPGIVVPVILLDPVKRKGRAPVVIGLAQAGKAGFLKERAGELEKLIAAGVAVILPDLRGTGETRAGSSRGADSTDTDLSVHVQLFGETLLGQRLRDLRSVLAWLRGRKEFDAKRIALWGESFTPPNGADTTFRWPHRVEGGPRQPEPLGGLLALLGALFEEDVRAVDVAGGLAAYHGVLTHFAVLVPHDACVPGALTAGDLCDLAASLAPRPLRLEALVDHLNRPVSAAEVKKEYAPAVVGFARAPRAISFGDDRSSTSAWLVEQLR
jgi:hypothetical protein